MLNILLVFIALKWTGAITWSWGIVFTPLWIWLIVNIGALLLGWWLGLD